MTNLSRFDERTVDWQPLPDVDHVWLSILNVDDTAKIVDVLFKFSAHEKIYFIDIRRTSILLLYKVNIEYTAQRGFERNQTSRNIQGWTT